MFGMDELTWRLVGGAGLIFTGIIIVETLPSRTGRAEPVATGDAMLPVAGEGAVALRDGGGDGPSRAEGDDDAERAGPPPGTVD